MSAIWIAGRPASGKTSLALRIVESLRARGRRATVIDSDEVRAAIAPRATYTPEERELVYAAIAYTARRVADEGVIPVVAATAHTASLRAQARSICGSMVWVYAKCSLAVCEARDPKGLYRRARALAHGGMPGVHVPFEEPEDADIVVDTSATVDEATIARIMAMV